ncbi:MAG: hypothetical protein ACI8P3_002551 [Saprospiraceae bacterium]|jgi:hypothetical protein
MFKILMIGGLLYLLYTMVFNKPLIPGGKEDMKIDKDKDKDKDKESDDGEYVDYEEVD